MTDLEAAFDTRWRQLGGPALLCEHRFAEPRRWRFDRCDLMSRVAVELEGGVYSGGRHVRGKGFEGDAEKYNAAAAAGWVVFRLTAGMLDADPVGHLMPIIATITARQPRSVSTSSRLAAQRRADELAQLAMLGTST